MKRAVLVLGLAGCLETQDMPARWHYLHAAVLQPSCTTAGCHSKLTAIAGVDLSSADSAYTVLTGRICGEPVRPQNAPRNYVTPGSSTYSQLVYQLRGHDADGRAYRKVMPPDTPLPDVEIDAIARWIDAGAECD
jgi:hypothetical protein